MNTDQPTAGREPEAYIATMRQALGRIANHSSDDPMADCAMRQWATEALSVVPAAKLLAELGELRAQLAQRQGEADERLKPLIEWLSSRLDYVTRNGADDGAPFWLDDETVTTTGKVRSALAALRELGQRQPTGKAGWSTKPAG